MGGLVSRVISCWVPLRTDRGAPRGAWLILHISGCPASLTSHGNRYASSHFSDRRQPSFVHSIVNMPVMDMGDDQSSYKNVKVPTSITNPLRTDT